MKPSRPKDKASDQTRTAEDRLEPATVQEDARLTPEERTRLVADLQAELQEGERSIREDGVVTAEELRRRLDAMFEEWSKSETATEDQGG